MNEHAVRSALDEALTASQIRRLDLPVAVPEWAAMPAVSTRPVECMCVPISEWTRLALAIRPAVEAV
jgi:hypothetical protein